MKKEDLKYYVEYSPEYDPSAYGSETTEREGKAIYEALIELIHEKYHTEPALHLPPSQIRIIIPMQMEIDLCDDSTPHLQYLQHEKYLDTVKEMEEEFSKYREEAYHKAISIGLARVENNEDNWTEEDE